MHVYFIMKSLKNGVLKILGNWGLTFLELKSELEKRPEIFLERIKKSSVIYFSLSVTNI